MKEIKVKTISQKIGFKKTAFTNDAIPSAIGQKHSGEH